MKKYSIKSWLAESIQDGAEKPFFRLAKEDIKSISGANINKDKKVLCISFKHNDGRDMKLKVKDRMFHDWRKKQDDKSGLAKKFLFWFLENSKPKESQLMSEIVDDYNNIIGDDDMPKNGNNTMVGMSTTDSDTAVYQTRAKAKSISSWGIGFITW